MFIQTVFQTIKNIPIKIGQSLGKTMDRKDRSLRKLNKIQMADSDILSL